ncbi:sensor histidine kinase [Tenacibaculum sp. M341]|uniref:sensor histidine kinase n=1 Tax=Tenacibaculum sp. M341 TaxID=2530339 RepID=UPI0010510C96|nr:histidine kinase [Tenacibaculum sp. M341]TCI92742.1 hypothetical protein EYW44_07550 [Tenacibaculum sp. M341]
MNRQIVKIGKHIFFWIGVFLFYILSSTEPNLLEQTVISTLLKFPSFIIAAYTFNYWQVPYYLKKKKYIFFMISVIIVIVILVLLSRVIGYYYLDKFCKEGPYPFISLIDFPFYMMSFHLPALILYFYKTNKEGEIKRERIYQLEKEKISTELKYLKAQLNPHFLFNTLNNLYSFVITKSPKAPNMILQLSGILDYVLYKSQQPYVFLKEEIQTIENYIALEQIKYGDRLNVDFSKNIQNEQQHIIPLLLLSIVENAFKHGVSGSVEKPEVKIVLTQTNSIIEFVVCNTKLPAKEVNKTDDYKEGIGLKNIKRQLDLAYFNKHTFEIEELETFFKLKLCLK